MIDNAHHTGHASADDQYLATPPGAGYEHTDANVWIVVKFLLWLAVSAGIISTGIALLFSLFVTERAERAEPRFPLAVSEEPRLPPEPRLQRFPREDIMNYRLGAEATLQSYGWTDKAAGTVHIPIQEAMRLLLERRVLVSRPSPPPQTPDSRPSDANAGRALEKR